MEIDYELEAKDFFEFGKVIAPKQKSYNPTVVLYLITFTLFISTDFIYAVYFGSLSDWNQKSLTLNVLARLVITILLIGIVMGIINLIGRRLTGKVAGDAKNGILCRHKIILSEKELVEVTDVNISRYAWSGIGKIERLGDFVVIEVSSSFSYIIPQRFFRDSKHLDDFLRAANSFKRNTSDVSSISYLVDYNSESQTKF